MPPIIGAAQVNPISFAARNVFEYFLTRFLSRAKAFREQVPDVEMRYGMPAVGMIHARDHLLDRSFRPIVGAPVHTLDCLPHVHGEGPCGGTVVELMGMLGSSMRCGAWSRMTKNTSALAKKKHKNITTAEGGSCLAWGIAG